MTISVIIPVYNNPDDLAECVAAIRSSGPEVSEIIVVNDASTDRTASVAASSGARVINLEKNSGPAAARNRGAHAAGGEILMFVDADVIVAPGAVHRVASVFKADPELSAVFGSYDVTPRAAGIISQYRNLLHHFVHQTGNPEAGTFWAGFGAVRKSVFERMGGFDEKRFLQPSIEDIEFGYRLRTAGGRILLDKGIQGKHLKRWRLGAMLKTDIFQRALPWSRLILETKHLPNDLNVKSSQRVSCFLAMLACAMLGLAVLNPSALFIAAGAFGALIVLNRDLYRFFARQRGILFAALCVPLHLSYYLYSGLSYLWVWLAFRLRQIACTLLRQRHSLFRFGR